ncbi:MAG: glycosyltransferase family 2 protein, partial [Chloroflexota bacterium]
MTESLVSVIIPNWNGYEHLPDCLDSLQNQTYSNTEVVVVDNASTDGSIQLIADQFPWVHVIRLDSNLGFTGACNIGLRESDGDILILLNNDTQVEQDWVE